MFTITLEPSGNCFQADNGQALLAAGILQGIALPYSCKTGICRTCKGKVLKGRVNPGEVAEKYLTPAERDQGFALLCRALALSDCTIEVNEAPRSFAPKLFPARVAAVDKLGADVAVISLRLPMNKKLMLLPGQYIEILLSDGQRRSYSVASLAGPEGAAEIELHVRRVPGGAFTAHVFDTLKVGEIIRFEGPLGSFFLRDSSRPILMLASGTGFGPIKAMLESLLQSRSASVAAPVRPVHLYWGGRRRTDLYMAERARSWADTYTDLHFVPVLSESDTADGWQGRTGLVHEAAMEDFADLGGYEVYACGAPAMVEAARRDFVARRALPESQFFADSFFTMADRRP